MSYLGYREKELGRKHLSAVAVATADSKNTEWKLSNVQETYTKPYSSSMVSANDNAPLSARTNAVIVIDACTVRKSGAVARIPHNVAVVLVRQSGNA